MKELIEIQAGLKAPKDKMNTFGGYRYRSLEGILEAVKPLLKVQGCVLIFNDEIVQLGDRYYLRTTATLTNSEGVSVSATAMAREAVTKKGMDEAQITGAASSYARKYALNALFAIDDTKDPDTDEYQKRTGGEAEHEKKAITSADIDNTITCESLLGWMFKKYVDSGYDQKFDCVAEIRKHYTVDDAVAKRFKSLYGSYQSAKTAPRL